MAHDEPLLFVGQINCADLRGLPGAEQLPASGLLSFFGDHDAVTGCFRFDSHCVFHWPDVGRLVAAKVDPAPIEVFPPCALVPRPILELPHPYSGAVAALGLNEQQRRSYGDVWLKVRNHAIPSDCTSCASFSKLWVGRLWCKATCRCSIQRCGLLLQVDDYCNGETLHGWGPGGSLFYVLPEADLRAHDFARCELEGQFT